MNLPLSSLLVKRHAPWPSCQMTFKRSPRLPLKQKRPPPMASRLSTSCTRKARLGKPHRMSVWPVASHTRTPVGIGIIGAPGPEQFEPPPQYPHRGQRPRAALEGSRFRSDLSRQLQSLAAYLPQLSQERMSGRSNPPRPDHERSKPCASSAE